jgi:hypothetical protein
VILRRLSGRRVDPVRVFGCFWADFGDFWGVFGWKMADFYKKWPKNGRFWMGIGRDTLFYKFFF